MSRPTPRQRERASQPTTFLLRCVACSPPPLRTWSLLGSQPRATCLASCVAAPPSQVPYHTKTPTISSVSRLRPRSPPRRFRPLLLHPPHLASACLTPAPIAPSAADLGGLHAPSKRLRSEARRPTASNGVIEHRPRWELGAKRPCSGLRTAAAASPGRSCCWRWSHWRPRRGSCARSPTLLTVTRFPLLSPRLAPLCSAPLAASWFGSVDYRFAAAAARASLAGSIARWFGVGFFACADGLLLLLRSCRWYCTAKPSNLAGGSD